MVNKEGITMDLNQVLIEAAKDGNMLVLKTALKKGADINATDRSGRTALMYAEKKGYKDLADFLRTLLFIIKNVALLITAKKNIRKLLMNTTRQSNSTLLMLMLITTAALLIMK